MKQEEHEATTVSNTVAIGELTIIAKQTSKDVDKIVTNLDKLIPVHEKVANLRLILFASIVVVIGFGTWLTIEYFQMKETLATHMAVQKQKEIQIENDIKKNSKEELEKINNNKNQITYWKGRVTGLDNQFKSSFSSGIKINQSIRK